MLRPVGSILQVARTNMILRLLVATLTLELLPLVCARAEGSGITICTMNKVTMPSAKQHYEWLAANKRYGPDVANGFLQDSRADGDKYIEYQIIYLPEFPGGSGWFDINGLSGFFEANSHNVKKWQCDGAKYYPMAVLFGLEAKAFQNGTLYVSPKRGLQTAISLNTPSAANKVIEVRVSGTDKLICQDLTVENTTEKGCSHPGSYFK